MTRSRSICTTEVYVFSAGAIGQGDASGVGPSIELNNGAAPNLQLHVIGNIAYDDPSGGPGVMGLGDTELGAKYRFISPGRDDWYPQVGVFALVEIPTGDAKRNLGAGYTQVFLPVWVQKNSASGRPTAAAATGSIPGRATATTGSPAGCLSAK